MRIKSNVIFVKYAGSSILSPGQHLAADSYSLRREYTTAAEPLLEAAAPDVRAHGNAQGNMTLPVCVNLASEPAAFREALSRLDFVEANQTGVLELTIDGVTRRWQAGIQSIEPTFSYAGNGVRLVVTYNIILGAAL